MDSGSGFRLIWHLQVFGFLAFSGLHHVSADHQVEVDQKFLGYLAKATAAENGYLSSFLFRVLGLSVLLSDQLLQARRAKKLDPVRDPKARRLLNHILWLAREGLLMVEQYCMPMVSNYRELKVLIYKVSLRWLVCA